MAVRAAGTVCLLMGLAVAGRAAEQPHEKPIEKPADRVAKPADALDRLELDRRTARAAHDAAAFGTQLFNGGNHEGCFRYYQATLATLHPLLDHRPKLAEVVRERLDKARDLKAVEGSFVLREALDAVQKETAAALAPAKTLSLWDRLGGEKLVRGVVTVFVAAAAADPKVNFTRGGTVKLDAAGAARLERVLTEVVSARSGGPLVYTGPDPATAFAGMKVTDDEYTAAAGHLAATLQKYKVPPADIDEVLKFVGTARPLVVGQ